MKKTLNKITIPSVEKHFDKFDLEVFSEGKTPKTNEDAWLANKDMFAVIDGSSHHGRDIFGGNSGGQIASQFAIEALNKAPKSSTGIDLADCMTKYFKEELRQKKYSKIIEKSPESRPHFRIVVVKVSNSTLSITQIGDVKIRINGQEVLGNSREIDRMHARMRIEAIKQLSLKDPSISVSELLIKGRNAIDESLHAKFKVYQNNPFHAFGFGVVDGRPIPLNFIFTRIIPLKEVNTIELFTDGYFKIPHDTTISAWEKAFKEVEVEDPYKIHEYPSTKGSLEGGFTDDRTILIARFRHSKINDN